MKYLSRATQANVAILLVAMRWLERRGPTEYDELAQALRPASVTQEADGALRATLDVGHHIGLVEASDQDGVWGLADADLGVALERHDRFRALVSSALLRRAVADCDEGTEPSDVAIGLTWLCSLDPARPLAWGWDDGPDRPESLVASVGLREVINGVTQWRTFRRWATALGFATASQPRFSSRRSVDVLIPDPTVAIADALPSMPEASSAREFVDLLAQRVPSIDSGRLEAPASELGVRYDARGEAALGPAVGGALERLERRGMLQLKQSADARNRVSYRVGGQVRTFDLVAVGRDD
jgi:hypothetical protein